MRAPLNLSRPVSPLRLWLRTSTALVALAMVATAPAPISAATLTFDNTVDGDWNGLGSNQTWVRIQGMATISTAFSEGDDVIFANTGQTVAISEDVEPKSITFNVDGYTIRPKASVDPEPVLLIDDSDGLNIAVTDSTHTATILAGISGSGDILVNGAGVLVLEGDNSGATGELKLDGGSITLRGGHGGSVDIQEGTLRASDGTIAGEVTVGGDGIGNDGTLRMSGSQFGGMVTADTHGKIVVTTDTAANVTVAGGSLTVNAGVNPDTITLTGDVTQTGGDTKILGGLAGMASVSGGTFDTSGDVSGALFVSGTGSLEVSGGTVGGKVRNDGGTMVISGGTISGAIQAHAGNTTIETDVSNFVTIGSDTTEGNLTIDPGVTVTGNVSHDDGVTTQNGTIMGNVTVDDANDDNDSIFNNNGDISGTVRVNGGTFNANVGSGGLVDPATITGLVRNQGGTINANGGVFTAGINNISGQLNITTDNTVDVTNNGGTVMINSGQTLTGALINNSGTTTNAGFIADVLNINGGEVVNNGEINNTVALSGGTLTSNAMSIVDGLITNDGGTVDYNGGTLSGGILNNSGTVNLLESAGFNVSNEGGHVTLAATKILSTDYTSNAGSTDNAGTMTGTIALNGVASDAVTDVFDNGGTLSGDVTVSGEAILNNTGAINGKLQITGGTVNADGGTFAKDIDNQSGRLNINANTVADVDNNGGRTDILSGQTLTGNIDNVAGAFNNFGTLDGWVDLTDGSVGNNGDITGLVTVGGGVFNANSGTITGLARVFGGTLRADGSDFDGEILAQAGGTVSILDTTNTPKLRNGGGDVFIRSGGNVVGEVVNSTGDLDLLGTITGKLTQNGGTTTLRGGLITDTVRINAGDMDISGGTYNMLVTNNGGTVTVSGGTFDQEFRNNAGSVDIEDDTIGTFRNAGGSLTVAASGSVTGDVINISGNVQQSGDVMGNVTVLGGTYDAQGAVTVLTKNDGGTINADGGSFDGGLRMVSGGLNVVGNSTGALVQTGGTSTIQAAKRWTGAATHKGGTTNNNGVVTGQVRVSGGSWNQNAGSNNLNQTILAGGAINAAGGRFTGGLVANSGTLTFSGDTIGDVTNNGISINLGNPHRLGGQFINNSGSLTIGGKLAGDLVLNGGTVTSTSTGIVTGATRVNVGTVNLNGGEWFGEVRNNGGFVELNQNTRADIRNAGGDVTINAARTLDGDIIQTAGSTTIDGTVSGRATAAGGNIANSGTIERLVMVSGGTFDHETGASLGNRLRVDSGTFNGDGGSIDGTVRVNGGEMVINEDTVIDAADTNVANAADLTLTGGELEIKAGKALQGNVLNSVNGLITLDGTLDGDLTNRGVVNASGAGTVTGILINTGEFNTDPNAGAARVAAFTLVGPTTVIGGLFDNIGDLTVDTANLRVGRLESTGTVSISNNKVLVSDTTADFRSGSTLTINDGTLAGEVDIESNTDVSLTDATIEGNVTSASILTSSGATLIQSETAGPADLSLTGAGGIDLLDGAFEVTGDLTATSNTSIDLAANTTLSANAIASAGATSFADGARINGAFTNTGVITGSGTLTFGNALRGGGRVDVSNGNTNDRVNINGNLGDQRFDLDIDLSGDVGRADRIVMGSSAVINGGVTLNFNTLGEGGEQDADVVVLDAAPGQGAVDVTVRGLPAPDDIVVYGVSQNASGDLVVFDALNQGISSLAGNIVLSQSLIGSVINRPSSPFVSGLAYEDENPCGPGVWARAIGGQADSTGRVEQTNGDLLSFDGRIEADYYGVQLGGDYACFNGFYDGWDLAFGAIGGANFGQSTQPVFFPDPNEPSGLSNRLTSVTDVEFTQTYAGVYLAAVRGQLAVDLQYRLEQTDFTANNVGASGGAGLGLTDETFGSEASTLSGAISYAVPVKDTGFTFVPTAGFAYTEVSTDPITFADRGVVQIDDFDSRTAFVGGTLSRTKFGDDGVSALTQFGTVTVYKDFAENPTSTYTAADGSTVTNLVTENLGTYGEISAGLNYVKILQPGEIGNAKQFNASIRGDVRVSDRLESWGITAQARIQF